MVNKEKTDPIEIRLNAIIRLLSELLISQDKVTQNSLFKSLTQAGLGPTEIANLFGKSTGEIGSQLTRAKKSKTKSKQK